MRLAKLATEQRFTEPYPFELVRAFEPCRFHADIPTHAPPVKMVDPIAGVRMPPARSVTSPVGISAGAGAGEFIWAARVCAATGEEFP